MANFGGMSLKDFESQGDTPNGGNPDVVVTPHGLMDATAYRQQQAQQQALNYQKQMQPHNILGGILHVGQSFLSSAGRFFHSAPVQTAEKVGKTALEATNPILAGMIMEAGKATKPVGNVATAVGNTANKVLSSKPAQDITKPALSLVNTLSNPEKDVNLVVGAGKSIGNSVKNVAGGVASDIGTGRAFKSVGNAAALTAALATGNKQAATHANQALQNVNSKSATLAAFNAPKIEATASAAGQATKGESLGKTITNPKTIAAAGQLAKGESTALDLATALGLGGQAIDAIKGGAKLGADTIAQVTKNIEDNGVAKGARRAILQTAKERGASTIFGADGTLAKQYAHAGIKGAIGELAKKGIDTATAADFFQSPTGRAIIEGISKPLAKAAVTTGAEALAKQGAGNVTGNKDLQNQAKQAFNENLKYPGSKYVKAIAPFAGASGVLGEMIRSGSSEAKLGAAAHPVVDYFGKLLDKTSQSQFANAVDKEVIKTKAAMGDINRAKYTDANGSFNLDKAVNSERANITKPERQAALQNVLDNSGVKAGMTPQQQAEQFKAYMKTQDITQRLEQERGLAHGSLTALRNDTMTQTAIQKAAHDLVNWHQGQLPESVKTLFGIDAPAAQNRIELGKMILKSPVATGWTDKAGTPIMGGLKSNEFNNIVQRIKDYSDVANRTIQLSPQDQAAIEKLGYQGVGHTPVLSTGTFKSVPQYTENKLLAAPTQVVRGNRNLAGKVYDMLDKTLGLTPTSNKVINSQFNQKLLANLEKHFPAGTVSTALTDTNGNPKQLFVSTQRSIEKGQLNPWLKDSVDELLPQLRNIATDKNKTLGSLSTRDLKGAFSRSDARTIHSAILKAIPADYKTQGLEAVQNTLRKYVPGFDHYLQTVNAIKYSKNPLFTKISYPLKTHLLMAANSLNPFYGASKDSVAIMPKLMHNMAEYDQISETVGKAAKADQLAANIAEQVARQGKFYGLSQNYKDLRGVVGTADQAKVADIAERILHYGDRAPLERSINTLLFPFSFEKKVASNIVNGLGRQSGILPILAMQGLNKLDTYMNSKQYNSWSQKNPAEAYLLSHFNPVSEFASKKFQGDTALEAGGQYLGFAKALEAGVNAAATGQTSKTALPLTSPFGRAAAAAIKMGSNAGAAGIGAKAIADIFNESSYQQNALRTRLGEAQFVAHGGSSLTWMQAQKMAGNPYYNKFFKAHPETDPYSSQFNGKLFPGLNELPYKQVEAGYNQAKNNGEALQYMQNMRAAGVTTYNKFFGLHPELDPQSSQFVGYHDQQTIAKLVSDLQDEKALRKAEVNYYKNKEINTYERSQTSKLESLGKARITKSQFIRK